MTRTQVVRGSKRLSAAVKKLEDAGMKLIDIKMTWGESDCVFLIIYRE